MATRTRETTLTMAYEICIKCGIPFGVPVEVQQQLRDTHRIFYCPNGHEQYYSGPSEAEKLRQQVATMKKEISQRIAAQDQAEAHARDMANRARASKAALTRLKNQVQTGQCPCCHRRFVDLECHMRDKHPAWEPEEVTP